MKNQVTKVNKQILMAIILILIFTAGLNSWVDGGEELQHNAAFSTRRLDQTGETPPQKSNNPIVDQLAPNPKVTKINAPINVACVFAVGGLGDKGFNDMVYAGLQKAQADGLCTFDYVEPTDVGQYQGLLAGYASSGSYDLIVAIGYDIMSAVNTIALNYPSQPFLLIDSVVIQGNVKSVMFEEQEGSFLVGAMAGLMTQTGRVGFIGGMDIPLIRKFWAGYTAGVLYEKNNSYIEVIEDFVGAWDDPVTGKNIAEAMWAEGVDIIYAAAGASGHGALESANEQGGGFYAIGVDADQDYLYPGRILCSMMKRVDVAVYNAIKDVYDANWIADVQTLGLVENGVGISPFTYTKGEISPEKIQEVNVTVRNKIISGEITVPTNNTNLAQWVTDMNIVTKTYTHHARIPITSSSHFTSLGFDGTGTIDDPYRIEGLYINETSVTLISISNIADYFIIGDNLLNGLNSALGRGIFITNSLNGTIANNTIIRTGDGIRLENSDDNNIIANAVFNNNYGVVLDTSSDNNTVSFNTLSHNNHDGLAIGGSGGSHDNEVFNNTFNSNVDSGMWLSDSTNNDIFNNTISNGNGDGIILGLSDGNNISHNIIFNNHNGLYMGSSNDNVISKNTIFSNEENGIVVVGTSQNTVISGNLVFDNQGWAGIDLGSSIGSIVDNNKVYNQWNGNGIVLGYYGMALGKPSEFQIINNTIYNCLYRGIRVEFSDGNVIKGNNVYSNDEDGIWLISSFDNILDGNIVHNNTWNGFFTEVSSDNVISDNTIYDNDGGINVWNSNYTIISNNTVYNNDGHGISVGSSNQSLIVNNTVFYSGNCGIWTGYSQNNTIINNTVSGSAGWGALTTLYTIEIYIYNNTVKSNPNNGIFIESSHKTVIGYNRAFKNMRSGINIVYSPNSVCIMNLVHDNNGVGIRADFSSNMIIDHNTVDNNEAQGIWIGNSGNITISHNLVFENSGINLLKTSNSKIINNSVYKGLAIGILLEESDKNTIAGNLIFDNVEQGISIQIGSNRNTIRNNDFSGNNVAGSQVSDDGSNNVFILNYWSDWTSPDADGDGIVDNPYSIDEENQDPYPLVSPDTHALTPPVPNFPNGGKVFSGVVSVGWLSVDSFDHSITYDVYYSHDGGNNWNLLKSGLTTTNYDLDTTTVADGTYRIKVVATCSEGEIKETISDLFTIQNEELTTTATTATTSDKSDALTISTPGMTGMIVVLSIAPIIILKKVKRKTR